MGNGGWRKEAVQKDTENKKCGIWYFYRKIKSSSCKASGTGEHAEEKWREISQVLYEPAQSRS